MCYIFSCFEWTIDFVQRSITFCMTCLLGAVLVCGCAVVTIAGIAYGYNYCLAEFLSFPKANVTVVQNRLFERNPGIFKRTLGEREEDRRMMSMILRHIDREHRRLSKSNAKLLNKTATDSKYARRYAAKLQKYANTEPKHRDGVMLKKLVGFIERPDIDHKESITTRSPSTIPSRITMMINVSIATTAVWQNGSSEIVMRNFQPHDISGLAEGRLDKDFFYTIDMRTRKTSSADTDSATTRIEETSTISEADEMVDIKIIMNDEDPRRTIEEAVTPNFRPTVNTSAIEQGAEEIEDFGI